MKSFIQNFFVKPPVIFPLVACFLIFLSIYELQSILFTAEVETVFKLRPILMILATVFWIGATYFQRWGALCYVILTIISVALYYFSDESIVKNIFGNLLMLKLPIIEKGYVPIPLSAIFSFIALYFYPKMK